MVTHAFILNDSATTEIYTLFLHHAFPIYFVGRRATAYFQFLQWKDALLLSHVALDGHTCLQVVWLRSPLSSDRFGMSLVTRKFRGTTCDSLFSIFAMEGRFAAVARRTGWSHMPLF